MESFQKTPAGWEFEQLLNTIVQARIPGSEIENDGLKTERSSIFDMIVVNGRILSLSEKLITFTNDGKTGIAMHEFDLCPHMFLVYANIICIQHHN